MRAAELQEALAYLYGEDKTAARLLACELDTSTQTVKGWLQGRARIPNPAALAIRLLRELPGRFRPAMTPAELDGAIDTLYDDPLVSQRQYRLAAELGVSLSTILSWRSGRRPLRGPAIRPLRGPAMAAIRLLLKKKRREGGG
jgi:DNA-binding transcriptional regulator YiaG